MKWWNKAKLQDLKIFVHSEHTDGRITQQAATEINRVIQEVLKNENDLDIKERKETGGHNGEFLLP